MVEGYWARGERSQTGPIFCERGLYEASEDARIGSYNEVVSVRASRD